jgi:nitric oxide reductase NorD protein
MSGIAQLFEPEELFGAFWHRMVGEVGQENHYHDAAVELDGIRRRLEIFFRAMGGRPGVEIKAVSARSVAYRQKLLAKLGHGSTNISRARFDGDHLFLPERIELLNDPDANEKIYKWLTAWAATLEGKTPQTSDDPLQNDIFFIRFAVDVVKAVFEHYRGMKNTYLALAPLLLAERQQRKLPEQEAAIEACICALLAGKEPAAKHREIWQAISNHAVVVEQFKAPKGYKTFLPVALWGEVSQPPARFAGAKTMPEDATPDAASEQKDGKTRKAKRQKSDQVDNKNSLILHRFESILSWAEMMNIPRAVEDDDEDHAQKAADDSEEMGLGNIAKKAATKLKFDLDLAPEDVEHEELSAKYTYPEWDYRENAYLPNHCRVLAATAPELEEGSQWQPDADARRRIRAVKRQFEALRPRQERFMRQVDGNEIDMDALIRSRCDMAANGESSNRVFTTTRQAARDLSVSVLIDISRSSESWIEGRQVIDISREALMALTIGLAACGDDNALYSFSSLRRDRVMVSKIKGFEETLGPRVFSRIGALKPGFYTRLGTAIRHVNAELSRTASTKRLLLVLTDGKPNDLDHYEGRYGIEDTARAVREARRAGSAVFGITIDKKAQGYFPYIFGRNAFAITNHANDLTRALPQMYRHLVK